MAELTEYQNLQDGEIRLVKLTCLTGPQPTEIYVGPARFSVMALPAAPSIRRGPGHVHLTVTTLGADISWAEYTTNDGYCEDGALYVEDYRLELLADDHDPDEAAIENAAAQLVAETELATAIAGSFVGIADQIVVGDTTIPVAAAPRATLDGYGDTVTTGDQVRVYWGDRNAPAGQIMCEGTVRQLDAAGNRAVVHDDQDGGPRWFALHGAGFRRRFEKLT